MSNIIILSKHFQTIEVIMKKVFLVIIVLTLLLAPSCRYRLKETKDGRNALVFPDGTKYYSTNIGYWCINRGYNYKGETLGKLPCPYCDDDCELDIFIAPNAPNNNIVLTDYAFVHGLDGYANVYIKEGAEPPTFTATDTLEAVYYLSTYEYFEKFNLSRLDETKQYLETKLVSRDIKGFADKFIEYEHDYNNDRLDGYDLTGYIIYKFKDTGDLYFKYFVGYSEDEKKFAIEGLTDGKYCVHFIPKEDFEKIVCAEIREILQWPLE